VQTQFCAKHERLLSKHALQKMERLVIVRRCGCGLFEMRNDKSRFGQNVNLRTEHQAFELGMGRKGPGARAGLFPWK
jgi:hypothetical protein